MTAKMRFTGALKLLALLVVGLVLLVFGQTVFKHLRIDLTGYVMTLEV